MARLGHVSLPEPGPTSGPPLPRRLPPQGRSLGRAESQAVRLLCVLPRHSAGWCCDGFSDMGGTRRGFPGSGISGKGSPSPLVQGAGPTLFLHPQPLLWPQLPAAVVTHHCTPRGLKRHKCDPRAWRPGPLKSRGPQGGSSRGPGRASLASGHALLPWLVAPPPSPKPAEPRPQISLFVLESSVPPPSLFQGPWTPQDNPELHPRLQVLTPGTSAQQHTQNPESGTRVALGTAIRPTQGL